MFQMLNSNEVQYGAFLKGTHSCKSVVTIHTVVQHEGLQIIFLCTQVCQISHMSPFPPNFNKYKNAQVYMGINPTSYAFFLTPVYTVPLSRQKLTAVSTK